MKASTARKVADPGRARDSVVLIQEAKYGICATGVLSKRDGRAVSSARSGNGEPVTAPGKVGIRNWAGDGRLAGGPDLALPSRARCVQCRLPTADTRPVGQYRVSRGAPRH